MTIVRIVFHGSHFENKQELISCCACQHDLSCVTVELAHMHADTADFIVGVDKKLQIGSRLFEDCVFLFVKLVNVLIAPMELPCLVMHSRFVVRQGFESGNCHAKHLSCKSDFSPSMSILLASLKCRFIIALDFCQVFSVHTFPVLLSCI